MKTAKYRFIQNQFLLGNVSESDLVVLVTNKHITDADRLEIIALGNEAV